jgi:hypothetical protein
MNIQAQRLELSAKMQDYYENNQTYHSDVSEISSDRPSEEEKQLFRAIKQNLSFFIFTKRTKNIFGLSMPKFLY